MRLTGNQQVATGMGGEFMGPLLTAKGPIQVAACIGSQQGHTHTPPGATKVANDCIYLFNSYQVAPGLLHARLKLGCMPPKRHKKTTHSEVSLRSHQNTA